jgi:hypothetical protein
MVGTLLGMWGKVSRPPARVMASLAQWALILLVNAVLPVKRDSRPGLRIRGPRSRRSVVVAAPATLAARATMGTERAACRGTLGARTGASGLRRANNAGMFETKGSHFKLFWRSNALR